VKRDKAISIKNAAHHERSPNSTATKCIHWKQRMMVTNMDNQAYASIFHRDFSVFSNTKSRGTYAKKASMDIEKGSKLSVVRIPVSIDRTMFHFSFFII